MTRHIVEPFTFDEKQQDDKAMLRRSLTPWQKTNSHRVRINSDTDGEVGNAVNFIGIAKSAVETGWLLSDSVGHLKLRFDLNTEWKTNCSIPIKVKFQITVLEYRI